MTAVFTIIEIRRQLYKIGIYQHCVLVSLVVPIDCMIKPGGAVRASCHFLASLLRIRGLNCAGVKVQLLRARFRDEIPAENQILDQSVFYYDHSLSLTLSC